DRDDAIQPRVARLVDFAHAAFADGGQDLVRAEPSSRRKGHCRRIISGAKTGPQCAHSMTPGGPATTSTRACRAGTSAATCSGPFPSNVLAHEAVRTRDEILLGVGTNA